MACFLCVLPIFVKLEKYQKRSEIEQYQRLPPLRAVNPFYNAKCGLQEVSSDKKIQICI